MRDTFASGDLLFASGDYLVPRTIQKFSGSPRSHVGIVFRLDSIDRVLLLESVEDIGVRFIPLSKYLTDYEHEKPYRGRVILARCEGVDAEIVSGLAGFGIDEVNRPYRHDEVAEIMARIALGIGKKERDTRYVCSELVSMSASLMRAKSLSTTFEVSLRPNTSGSMKRLRCLHTSFDRAKALTPGQACKRT